MITYETTATITDVGIAAAIAAGRQGPQINVGGFRIGTNSAVQGAVALPTDTDVDGFAYAGTYATMSYSIVNADTVVWRIRLDTTVGNFDIGNVGLVLQDGTFFCKAVLAGQVAKWQSNPPTTVGNVYYINVVLRLAGISTLLNLTIVESMDCSLPEVPTELQLPDPQGTPYDAYLVDNHTHAGIPTTSVRLNDQWWHAAHRAYPGQGHGVVVATPGAFATSPTPAGGQAAPALGPVGYDSASGLFVAADGASDSFFAVGIRTSSFEITTLGTVPGSACGLTGSLVPYTVYYAETGSGVGDLTASPQQAEGDGLCVATSTTDVYVDTVGAYISAVTGEGGSTASVEADLLALLAHETSQRISMERHQRRVAERTFVISQALAAAAAS